MFKKLADAIRSKIFATKVRNITQEGCDLYIAALQSILKPIPELAEDIATVVINNQDEIERTIQLAHKMHAELDAVFNKHAANVKAENKELNKLITKFSRSAMKFKKDLGI